MRVIGLTGGIGSGKSTVADCFRKNGIPVLDADLVSHEVYQPGTETYRKIIEEFGDKILTPDGTVNRKILGDLVYTNNERRLRLEDITHPEIEKRMRDFIHTCKEEGHRFCIIEAALIFEKGKGELFDRIITVSARRVNQIERIKGRDGLASREIETRIDSQLPIEEKVRRSDFVIDNSGSRKDTETQVERIIDILRTRGTVS